MLSILRKKILKVVPIWLLVVMLIISLGVALASFNWISNKYTSTVTISPIMITLGGTPVATGIVNDTIVQKFNYTVNTKNTLPYGYISTNITGPLSIGTLYSLGLSVQPFGDGSPTPGSWPVESVAVYGDPGFIQFTWGNFTDSNKPFNFGMTNGTITVIAQLTQGGTYNFDLQVTSTLP